MKQHGSSRKQIEDISLTPRSDAKGFTAKPAERILRRKEVERATGLSRSSIYAQMSKGHFPQSIQLSERASGWLESEIVAWQQARIAKRDRPILPVSIKQTDRG